MNSSEEKSASRVETVVSRLMQPVTVTMPGYGLVAAALVVLALVVVALD